MKWGILFFLIIFSSVAFCNPKDSTRMAERQKHKIEKEKKRSLKRWDERSFEQRRNDRRALIFLAISAGVLVQTISHKE